MGVEFEPRIVAFMCNWCTYAGADNAGVARLESPSNILPIRVMCSGRISPEMVVRDLLGYVGVNPERMELCWVSASEAPRFVEVTKAFTQRIRELGPLAQEV